MSRELLPCPFCGSKNLALWDNGDTGNAWWVIACPNCEVKPEGWWHSEAEAVAAWNRRAGASRETAGEATKLTTELRYAVRRVEEEMTGEQMGEARANAQQAFDELVRLIRGSENVA